MRKILILLVVVFIGVGLVGKVEANAPLGIFFDLLDRKADLEYINNECKLFKEIREVPMDGMIGYTRLKGTLDAVNTLHTMTRGNFQVVMREMGIVLGQGVEAQMQAGYGIIAYNIMLYVGDGAGNTERATLLKTAALEIERKTPPKPGTRTSEELNAILALFIGHYPHHAGIRKGYESGLDFASMVTLMLFSKKMELDITRMFPGVNYFPDSKRDLVRALAIGNFEAVDNLLNREKIRTAHGLWKDVCSKVADHNFMKNMGKEMEKKGRGEKKK